ncbi:TRAP transporter small permease [Flavobacteriaceae bacterium 3-367]|uniref:TRAP transporter small permease n=1 Tax=Eudoraea algarum TaxID=3417568 RepID=UPI0032757BE8
MMIRNKIDRILSRLLMGIMSLMVLNVLWQVFSRYILGAPSSFTDELSRYLMIWLGILGAAYVSGQNAHVAIDFLPKKLNTKKQRKLRRLVTVIVMSFAFFALVIGGFRLVYLTFILEQYSPALKLPLALVYLVMPLSGMLIMYYKISDILTK